MSTLQLTLKKKWFDMIASGEKKEEYRGIKPYWIRRFTLCQGKSPIPHGYTCKKAICWSCLTRGEGMREQAYHTVTARNGYSGTAPTIQWENLGIRIGKPNPAWCEPEDIGKTVFILSIGEVKRII